MTSIDAVAADLLHHVAENAERGDSFQFMCCLGACREAENQSERQSDLHRRAMFHDCPPLLRVRRYNISDGQARCGGMPQHLAQSLPGLRCLDDCSDQDEAMRRAILGLTLALTLTWPATAERSKFPRQAVKLVTAKAVTKPEKAVRKGLPAKELFGSATAPAPLAARSIGSYAKGCLAGGVALPINGPDWQVMRLSRNRNWGNPRLLEFS